MGRGAIRGHRLGRATAEPDRKDNLADRVDVRFACTKGHEFGVQFAADAEVPAEWVCRLHGIEHCRRIDSSGTAVADSKTRTSRPPRTPLVLLYERRTEDQLKALLTEMLAAIRRQGGVRPGCVIIGSRAYSFRLDA